MTATQPDLFQPDFNLASATAPDTSGWTVHHEALRRDAIQAERDRQTHLPDVAETHN